ncbi:AarF/ABC1/UbiB kinase family protein [Pseudonocardia sp.]|uniref:ABC1 kinase family protein n=1 Tax=Pseudonocardia sp. TaxID=60912 RepID=UPI002611C37F|nr:AarF/ABC1/UbiB kinase family protein [Pseudonocardia sp.]
MSPEPLAAASIAQVHAVRLGDGSAVVVKVQRTRIAQVVAGDLDILDRIARRLERSTPWGRSLGIAALADGFAASLREELDFRTEARNIATVAAGAARRGVDDVVRTPRVHEATRRVLVMERFSGRPVDEAGPEAAPVLLDCLLGQILVDGVFHADPHPGNIPVLGPESSDGAPLRLGLLDLGSVGRLDGGLRESLARLLLALDRDDPVAVVDALLEVVDAPDGLDERAVVRSMGRLLARHLGPGATLDAAAVGELFALLARHGLSAPPELAAVLRALGTLEGTLTRLDPGFDLVAGARAFASAQVAARMEPAAVRRAVTDELAALLPLVRRLPRRVDRIVSALDSGQLTVRVAAQAPRTSGGVLSAVLVTAIAATTGVMAALLLVSAGGPPLTETMTVDQLLGYLLLAVSAQG